MSAAALLWVLIRRALSRNVGRELCSNKRSSCDSGHSPHGLRLYGCDAECGNLLSVCMAHKSWRHTRPINLHSRSIS